jgi:hypothetical protein
MSTRESYTGAHINSLAPHYAPYSTLNRRDSFQLAGRSSLRPVSRSHGTRRKIDHASITRSLIDAAAVVFALLFVSVTGIGLVFAVFCLLFVSL